MSLKSITTKQFLIKDKLNLEHINLLFCTCLKPQLNTNYATLLDVRCWIRLRTLLRVVVSSYIKQSLKPVKLLSQRLPTYLWFRNRQSVAQQCWIRCTDLRTFLGPRTRTLRIVQKSYGLYPSHDALQFRNIVGSSFYAI